MEQKIRKSVLGRGLNSLIPVSAYDREFVRQIKIDEIISNRFQPRHYFEEDKLKDLVNSIAEHGVIQPVIVRKGNTGYELIAGERRYMAAKRLGLNEIPALIKNVDDQKSLEIALIENIQRDDLNPIEEAKGYQTLCKEFKLSQDVVAKKVGRSRTSITNSIRLLKLPEPIQNGLIEGSVSVGHAKVILGVADKQERLKIFERVVKKGLNVRDTEKLVRSLSALKTTKRRFADPNLKYKYKEYAESLRNRLETDIDIKWNGETGKIVIHFKSEKELDKIVDRFQQNSAVPC